MAQEIPSVVSRLTASLAYSTPCWIFFIRSSTDEVCSCLSTIDKFRKDTLFLSYKNKRNIKNMFMPYVRNVTIRFSYRRSLNSNVSRIRVGKEMYVLQSANETIFCLLYIVIFPITFSQLVPSFYQLGL